jgi:hypothetical protein
MLTERREAVLVQSLWIERLVFWDLARQPAHRIPTAVVAERQRAYFRRRLEEAVETLPGDSEPLAEVLEEILLIATGEDVIINWRPLSLEEARARIGEPLARP